MSWKTDPSYMSQAEYRNAIEFRFLILGRDGANWNLKHPFRKQWEQLRAEIESWKEQD